MADRYSDKLKDPRWQKKRLEIFQRDDWTCQSCYDRTSTLNVHHRRYLPDKEPWDYPNYLLITLCDNCHVLEKEMRAGYESDLIEMLREKFFADGIESLAKGFHMMDIVCYDSRIVIDAYAWALSNPDIQRELAERYFNSPKKE